MTGPLYMWGVISYGTSLGLGVLIGFAFGLFLERSGFGDARVLVDIFYFRDMRVLKVMFSAIVTAMVSLLVLSWLGLFNYQSLLDYALLKTYFWPQLAGGIVFGIGFVIGGYCPGTSMVGIASGKLDAVVFFLGMFGGVITFAAGFPVWQDFYASSAWGRVTLWQLAGIDKVTMGVIIVVAGLVAFYAASKAEQWAPYDKNLTKPPETTNSD